MRESIQSPENEVFLSVVALWEIIVKYQLGKLPLPESQEKYIPLKRERHRIESPALTEASVTRLATLSSIHRDPFDRMMICQTMEHGMALMTVDEALASYPVPLWRHEGDRQG